MTQISQAFPYRYIAIEGNIGAGKTSLARRIAGDFHTKLILEQFEENSFLPKFYKDPSKYAFPLELSFLSERYEQLKTELLRPDLFYHTYIADYFIHKSYIFARKNLSDDTLLLYKKLFDIIIENLPKPDLVVYLFLNTQKLLNNIRKRGRIYEQEISASYLENIHESYMDFFRHQTGMRILIVHTDNLDFVENTEDYLLLVNLLKQEYRAGIHRIIPKVSIE